MSDPISPERIETRPVKHRVIEQGHAVLLIDEDPQWIIPTAYFSVAFYANPKEVLKYGSNGLHFAEHILWNMAARHCLRQSNASTFSTGEMAVYGICLEHEFRNSLAAFLGGLIDMAECHLSAEMMEAYSIEQRRVTCETESMQENSVARGGEQSKMFVYNTDLVRSRFSPDYVWKILLEECQLGKVVVIAHCKLSDDDVQHFEKWAEKFTTAWDARAKHVPKKVLLPVYYAPPYSMLCCRGRDARPKTVIRYDDDFNPIERAIIQGDLSPTSSPYPFTIEIREEIKPDRIGWGLRYYLDWNDQYFIAPLLSAYQGALQEEWITDLYTKSPKQLATKYGKRAMDKIIQAVKGRM